MSLHRTLAQFTVCSAAALVLAGCATRPESIHASFVSHEKFSGLDCEELAARVVATKAKLTEASRLQNEKANGDAVGVFFLGIPFSKLTGDHEAEIAQLKGELEALDTAQVKAECIELPPVKPVGAASQPSGAEKQAPPASSPPDAGDAGAQAQEPKQLAPDL